MIKTFWPFLFVAVLMYPHQDSTYIAKISKYRQELNEEYLDPEKSPLSKDAREDFKGHEFFPIKPDYAVVAQVERMPESRPFQMAMSTGGTQLYKRLAILRFELNGKEQELEAYIRFQAFGLSTLKTPVLIPVIDKTSGIKTYDGGRYLTFDSIPEGDQWVIDFNKLYNPYCAYSSQIACPLVPQANHLKIAIEAGIKGPVNY